MTAEAFDPSSVNSLRLSSKDRQAIRDTEDLWRIEGVTFQQVSKELGMPPKYGIRRTVLGVSVPDLLTDGLNRAREIPQLIGASILSRIDAGMQGLEFGEVGAETEYFTNEEIADLAVRPMADEPRQN